MHVLEPLDTRSFFQDTLTYALSALRCAPRRTCGYQP
jgi:hypothetical protein